MKSEEFKRAAQLRKMIGMKYVWQPGTSWAPKEGKDCYIVEVETEKKANQIVTVLDKYGIIAFNIVKNSEGDLIKLDTVYMPSHQFGLARNEADKKLAAASGEILDVMGEEYLKRYRSNSPAPVDNNSTETTEVDNEHSDILMSQRLAREMMELLTIKPNPAQVIKVNRDWKEVARKILGKGTFADDYHNEKSDPERLR